MLRRHRLQALALVWFLGGPAGSLVLLTHVGLVKGAWECFAPRGQPCFHVGHPYILQGFAVLAVTILGALILWGQGIIRSRGLTPPPSRPHEWAA